MPRRFALPLVAVLLGTLLASCGRTVVDGPVSLPSGFDLEAHQGGRDARPDSTLPAFAYALAIGVTTLEMDLQITADGVIVVSHNTLIPWYKAKGQWGGFITADEQPAIPYWTLEDLRKFDLGSVSPDSPYGFWDAHGKTQKQVPGTPIATLEEVFQLVQAWGNDTVFFNLEPKVTPYPVNPTSVSPAEWVAKVYEIVAKYHLESRVMIESFDWRTLVEMKKLDPRVATVALTANEPSWNKEGDEGDYQWPNRQDPSPWMAGLDIKDFDGDVVKAAHSIGADVLSLYWGDVTQSVVDEAHALGMRVVPYTVNDPELMRKLIGMKVDGLITDRPATLREVCVQLGVAVPPADPDPEGKPHFTGMDGL